MSYKKLDIKTGVSIIMEGFDVNTEYINEFPYNCGFCKKDGTITGDCWCMFPKALIWSWACGIRLFKNRKAGTYFYNGNDSSYNGIGKSGLGDWDGDTIMAHCTDISSDFKPIKPLELMLIKGHHMGIYLGKFTRNGKIYNSVEYNYFNDANNGLIPFYITNSGKRYWYKNGPAMGGSFDCHGKLSTWIDYSDSSKTEPSADEILNICKDVNNGKYGNNPQRKETLVKKYGENIYNKVQSIINMLYQ